MTVTRKAAMLNVALLGILAACRSEVTRQDPSSDGGGAATVGAGGEGATGGGGEAGTTPLSLTWTPCAVRSAEQGDGAACGTADVPLRWDQPDAGEITLFVKRIGPENATRQLWMLNGGPGASGSDFEPLAEYFVSLEPELAVYLPDHRGTGRSSRLGCPAQEDPASAGGLAIVDEEWDDCLAHVTATFGGQLEGFRTTEAARDVGWLVEQTNGPGQQVVIWGGSYGTRWLQRYIALFPEQADGLSMLGITHPSFGFETYDQRYNEIALEHLDACSADSFCSGKLGPDAAQKAQDVLEQLDGGHCAASGLTRTDLQRLFAYWLLWSWDERALIPAVIYRLERCNAQDMVALQFLASLLATPPTYTIDDEHHSAVLANHIALSEIWNGPHVSLQELQGVVDQAVASLAVGTRMRRRLDDWPRYTPDALVGQLYPTSVPMLMLEGELDPATPPAEAAAVGAFYNASNQHYVLIPGRPPQLQRPDRRRRRMHAGHVLFSRARPECAALRLCRGSAALEFRRLA